MHDVGCNNSLQIGRKLIHIGIGTTIFFLAYIFGPLALLAFSALCLVCGIPIALMIKSGIELPLFSLAIELFGRRSEKFPGKGAFMFFVGAMLASIFALATGKAKIAALALLPVVFGDGFATIIGLKFGRHKIAGRKTLEGTAAFIFASFVALFLATGNFFLSIAISFISAIVELFPFDDNLTLPFLSAVLLYIIH